MMPHSVIHATAKTAAYNLGDVELNDNLREVRSDKASMAHI